MLKKEQGKFIGSKPSYGYMRDPLDKGHLIPNPETDWIVKEIFKNSFIPKVIDGEKTNELLVGLIISIFTEVDKPGEMEIRLRQKQNFFDVVPILSFFRIFVL